MTAELALILARSSDVDLTARPRGATDLGAADLHAELASPTGGYLGTLRRTLARTELAALVIDLDAVAGNGDYRGSLRSHARELAELARSMLA